MKKGSVKRLLAAALAAVFTIGCLTGCGWTKETASGWNRPSGRDRKKAKHHRREPSGRADLLL